MIFYKNSHLVFILALSLCSLLSIRVQTKSLINIHSQVEENGIIVTKWDAIPIACFKNSWIGLFKIGANDNQFEKKFETSGDKQGIFTAKVEDADLYEVRYFFKDEILGATGNQVKFGYDFIDLSIQSNKLIPQNQVYKRKLSFKWMNKEFQKGTQNNFIGLYKLGLAEKVKSYEIEGEDQGEAFFMITEPGYYQLKYCTPNKILQTTELIIVQFENLGNITLEGSIVSGKVKITIDSKFQTQMDKISFKLVRIFEIPSKCNATIESSAQASENQIIFNKRYNENCGTYVAYLYKNDLLLTVSNVVTLTQPQVTCPVTKGQTSSNIKNIVIVIPENHSFLSYFGNYCSAPAYSNPICNIGSTCCETYPEKIGEDQISPADLDNKQNNFTDRNHFMGCQICMKNNGKMDKYIKGCEHTSIINVVYPCSQELNFAVASQETMKTYHQFARENAISDRYFQASVGQSSQNDMYFARASFVFKNNQWKPESKRGSSCCRDQIFSVQKKLYDPTVAHLLAACDVSLTFYAEGYDAAEDQNFRDCFPQYYDSSDIPFQYYDGIVDNPKYMKDFSQFEVDLQGGKLPSVTFIKALGIRTAHPSGGNLSDVQQFLKNVSTLIDESDIYRETTLLISAEDESGGFYDHIEPPPTSVTDEIEYGARIANLFIGNFAKKNYISHVTIEHSSLVKFIEWNWLSGETGQLNTRDSEVNNIGDLLLQEKAGVLPPEQCMGVNCSLKNEII